MNNQSINQKKIKNLHKRARLLQKARDFFSNKGVLEVDTPHLSLHGSVDAYIDLIPAKYSQQTPCYLNSSPEYAMKRLLAMGSGDIYQLAHVFRDGERGALHNPEFMLCEWYRVGFSYETMIQETLDFLAVLIGEKKVIYLTFEELFSRFDPHLSYRDLLIQEGIDPIDSDDDIVLIGQIMSTLIEPEFDKANYTVVTHYPPPLAMLSQVAQVGGKEVALRFEIYSGGYELANGFFELRDPTIQRKRMEHENNKRVHFGKDPFPLDQDFLQALSYLPPCSGVAVGFDRCAMLHCQADTIADVIPFAWDDSIIPDGNL